MFLNLPQHNRCEFRITPSCVENAAGRLQRLPKSPSLATRTQRCTSTWSVRADGSAVDRDDLTKGIPMYSPENETARPEHERAEEKAAEAGNLEGNSTTPASKLFAEADSIISTFPSIMTRKGRHKAESQVLRLFLAALAAGRQEMAV